MRKLRRQIEKHGLWSRKQKLGSRRRRSRRAGLIAASVMSLAVAAGGAAQAATITVMNTAESGPGSLRAALDAARDSFGPDTIEFDSSFNSPRTIDLTGGDGSLRLVDVSGVTIHGPGSNLLTIVGGGQDRIFLVDGAEGEEGLDFSISGMTLTGGHTPPGESFGGAIRSTNQNLTLTDVVITGNVADNGAGPTSEAQGFGGGISSEGGSLTIHDSVISNNSAGRPGDGVQASYAVGGGIVANEATVEIYDSTISGNTAHIAELGGGGGGLAVIIGSLRLERSTVSDNVAANTGTSGTILAIGGGIYIPYADMYILRSTISGNIAGNIGTINQPWGAWGGGVVHLLGPAYVVDSTISGNLAGSAPGAVGGDSQTAAGGLFLDGGATIVDSTIAGNTANGASVATGGGVIAASAPIQLQNTIVAGNQALDGPDLAGTFTASYLLVENTADANISGSMINNGPAYLRPLADYGGPTKTHAVPTSSLAFNGGDATDCLERDQRGVFRDPLAPCDIGAFEATPIDPALIAFDTGVEMQTIQGAGKGNPAMNRLSTFRNMLVNAVNLLIADDTAGACTQLQDALKKADGNPKPKDFVEGTGTQDLATAITNALSGLGCQ